MVDDTPKCTSEDEKKIALLEAEILSMASAFGDVTRAENNAALRKVAETHNIEPSSVNGYVPWDNPDVPYECECGQIIYSDSEHTHPGDEDHELHPSIISPEEEAAEYRREHEHEFE